MLYTHMYIYNFLDKTSTHGGEGDKKDRKEGKEKVRLKDAWRAVAF